MSLLLTTDYENVDEMFVRLSSPGPVHSSVDDFIFGRLAGACGTDLDAYESPLYLSLRVLKGESHNPL
jgi:hypothetical protein